MKKDTDSQLLVEVETLVNNLGFSVVEINSSTNKNRLKVNMVIFSDSGVGIDDCTIVHKTVFPRLELIYEAFDVYLEISSPGIDRMFKDAREFAVFNGKAVKIMYGNSNEWKEGIIDSVDDKEVTIVIHEVAHKILFSDIHKCKLDYLREGQKP